LSKRKQGSPQQEYKRGQFGAVWAWARGHFHRWIAARNWAARRVKIARDPKSKQAFAHAKGEYGKKVKAHKRRSHKNDHQGWPKRLHVLELFNNDNGLQNHLHVGVAADSRDELIQIEKIAVKHFDGIGLVREFPPFDPVECVHVGVSLHYQDSHDYPHVIRTCANKGNGLAADNGFARRQEFGNEIKKRYGADRCDF
jgi:hypothetical protein